MDKSLFDEFNIGEDELTDEEVRFSEAEINEQLAEQLARMQELMQRYGPSSDLVGEGSPELDQAWYDFVDRKTAESHYLGSLGVLVGLSNQASAMLRECIIGDSDALPDSSVIFILIAQAAYLLRSVHARMDALNPPEHLVSAHRYFAHALSVRAKYGETVVDRLMGDGSMDDIHDRLDEFLATDQWLDWARRQLGDIVDLVE